MEVFPMPHTCNKQHKYAAIFAGLSDSPGDIGRHKCAGCAYELGFEAGLNNQPNNYESIVHNLPDSQAGTVRHKDPEEAYNMGYIEGKAKFNDK
jgi:hypothetical protein